MMAGVHEAGVQVVAVIVVFVTPSVSFRFIFTRLLPDFAIREISRTEKHALGSICPKRVLFVHKAVAGDFIGLSLRQQFRQLLLCFQVRFVVIVSG